MTTHAHRDRLQCWDDEPASERREDPKATTARKRATSVKSAPSATPATPATHDDPRFIAVLKGFARDPALAAVAEEYAANQIAGGKRKFGSRALKVDGKIFAMLSHGRFVVKLPAQQVDAMVAAGDGEYFDPGHGRKMKEWLSLTGSKPSWLALAKQAHSYVGDR